MDLILLMVHGGQPQGRVRQDGTVFAFHPHGAISFGFTAPGFEKGRTRPILVVAKLEMLRGEIGEMDSS